MYRKSRGLSYSRDIRLMINNVRIKITELSKAEVLERANRSNLSKELILKINEEIEIIEGYLLVASLLG